MSLGTACLDLKGGPRAGVPLLPNGGKGWECCGSLKRVTECPTASLNVIWRVKVLMEYIICKVIIFWWLGELGFCAFSQWAAENELNPIVIHPEFPWCYKKATFFIQKKKQCSHLLHYQSGHVCLWRLKRPTMPWAIHVQNYPSVLPMSTLVFCSGIYMLGVVVVVWATAIWDVATVRRIMEFLPLFRSTVRFLSFFPDSHISKAPPGRRFRM